MSENRIEGTRTVVERGSVLYPTALEAIPKPPKKLFVVGDPAALQEEGLAVIGARKATPYGLGCARRFAARAASRGITVVSGGARGCDAEAHRAALAAQARTVVFLGGGCDRPYPKQNGALFQQVVDGGGALVSEQPWNVDPQPYMFRARNRLIAGISRAVLIVEAGLPSGTFSTADDALDEGKEVLVVPGAITSANARGSNRLLYQGARPIVDDESFDDALLDLFGSLREPRRKANGEVFDLLEEQVMAEDPLVAAIRAEPLGMDDLYRIARERFGEARARSELMKSLTLAEAAGAIARQPDGRFCARIPGVP